jgi:hypothetical protein
LNGPVTNGSPTSTYRLAPALGLALAGRTLVTVAGAVVVATVLGLAFGGGWVPAGVVALVGALLVAAWAWWLVCRAVAVRLSPERYDVRLLRGVGAAGADWSQVEEVAAASPDGTRCLVLRLRDGRVTTLPMAAIAGDPDAFARDVQRRVRDVHSPGTGETGGLP